MTATMTRTEQNTSVIATFRTHEMAEAAVRSLQRNGVDMTTLSIIGKDYHTDQNVVGYYNTGDRMKAWGKFGALWGGIWGILFGSAAFFIPGIGPILVGGPLVVWIVGVLESSVVIGGLSALGAALVSIGIPKDSALKYESEIEAGNFVLIEHGAPDEVARAKSILDLIDNDGLTVHAA